MSKKYTDEITRMKNLMNYGLNENVNTNNNSVELSQVAADGKTYGIVKEGTKYFIKVAPKKNTAILAEDYDYVGGFNNRKAYPSYTKASQAFNLKLMSVNEACGSKQPVKSQFNLNEAADWQTNETKETRQEFNRFFEIVRNMDNLLNENIHYIKEGECKNAPFCEKPGDATKKANKGGGGNNGTIGSPNQNLGLANNDKTFTHEKGVNPQSIQKKYEDGKINQSKDHQFGSNNIDMDGGNPFKEKSKLKESNVLAWDSTRKFVHTEDGLDRSHGTEIGDTAPWTENVNESEDWGSEGVPSAPGTGDAKKYKAPFDKNTKQPMSEEYIFEVEMDSEIGNDFPSANEAFGNMEEGNEDYLFEVTLNDFGKHPAYQKTVMSLPKTGDSSQWGRDWNDESTKSEKPFGSQIGSMAPYEKVIDDITDAIVCSLGNKKKD
jgi:hypothetical protein